ncbi:MAG: L-aspartate oxidase [Pseudomonadota bacterium]
MSTPAHFDGRRVPATVIVGAGLAGLFAALKLAPLPVTVLSPVALGDGASSTWAQGGIAAALGVGDTASDHARDTFEAGAGLVDPAIALGVAQEAGDRIADLLGFGVPFDQTADGAFIQSREAAHSQPRVVRVTGDRAGAAIMQALVNAARSASHIDIVEGVAVEGLSRSGAQDGDQDATFDLELAARDAPNTRYMLTGAHTVVLATGGIGGLYRETTNPAAATGRGIALAARAGAVTADCEFVQFHPTAIAANAATPDADPLAPVPLASEALRGEGATLVDAAGQRFMAASDTADRRGELGPRDVVARAVFQQVSDGSGAFLDCRTAIGDAFADAFPTIYAKCHALDIDPARDLIPVKPAEHYHMGGVRTDDRGETNVPNLWAIGEVAATGLHGANRLASNSLLEAVVFAARAAEDIRARHAAGADAPSPLTIRALPDGATQFDPDLRAAAQIGIRAIMAADVGVIREASGLRRALDALYAIQAAAEGDPDIENMAIAARFVTEAALRRTESRGAHFRSDHPEPRDGAPQRITMTRAGLDLRHSLTSGDLLSGLMQAEAMGEDSDHGL